MIYLFLINFFYSSLFTSFSQSFSRKKKGKSKRIYDNITNIQTVITVGPLPLLKEKRKEIQRLISDYQHRLYNFSRLTEYNCAFQPNRSLIKNCCSDWYHSLRFTVAITLRKKFHLIVFILCVSSFSFSKNSIFFHFFFLLF